MISFGNLRRFIYGVDFSGAKDAGKKIWIARGVIREEILSITECFQAEDLPGSGRDREQSFRALREFISKQRDSIFGLDFPFGIPMALVKEESWEEFALSFGDIHKAPEEFKKECKSAAGGKELKRFTDVETKTPFSPYNLRLYRQTYFGIGDVLGPLVMNNMIRVLPMQRPLPDRAWVLEICPASTLKRENLSLSYKGGDKKHRVARTRILGGIERRRFLRCKEESLRSRILDNPGGDALDSVIAAFATFTALKNGFTSEENSPYALEGWVYV